MLAVSLIRSARCAADLNSDATMLMLNIGQQTLIQTVSGSGLINSSLSFQSYLLKSNIKFCLMSYNTETTEN